MTDYDLLAECHLFLAFIQGSSPAGIFLITEGFYAVIELDRLPPMFQTDLPTDKETF